jgi:hypothetical protein
MPLQEEVRDLPAVAVFIVQARVHAVLAALHNKTYPIGMILSALTDYNTGYSLWDKRLKKKTNRGIFPSTITTWPHE